MTEHWQDQAACRGASIDVFFPTQGEDVEPARQTCRSCEVREHCLDEHLNEPYGIWGGMTAIERKAERRLRGGSVKTNRCAWCLTVFEVRSHPTPATCSPGCAALWRTQQQRASRERRAS